MNTYHNNTGILYSTLTHLNPLKLSSLVPPQMLLKANPHSIATPQVLFTKYTPYHSSSTPPPTIVKLWYPYHSLSSSHIKYTHHLSSTIYSNIIFTHHHSSTIVKLNTRNISIHSPPTLY